MTFLELVQRAAFESGTVSGVGQPPTVVEQVGRLRHFVQWTASAYTAIQNRRPSWLWLRDEFQANLTANQQRYGGSDLSLDRLAEFVTAQPLSIYQTSVGVSDESLLDGKTWDEFYKAYLVGPNRDQTGKPQVFTMDAAGRLVFFPKPDATYTLRGAYRKTPQVLAANADVPEMPARFHELIVWKALLLLAEFDESLNQLPLWNAEYNRMMSELESEQLPRITLGGPLA
ncbi:hypothetical protein DEM27_10415 [Metarhizobium album]|uniref:Uncharacterized protein n=1 Tax=Metarhizobium album TaxID=2182425 RepID=A0A2U2DTZ1_9HYPH|nr:hypothetical protein [Rhizobium album]PWE56767.1 hypothetical protein DEM27_10415 [Rhizobium album]